MTTIREQLTEEQLRWLDKLRELGEEEILLNGEVYEEDDEQRDLE